MSLDCKRNLLISSRVAESLVLMDTDVSGPIPSEFGRLGWLSKSF